MILRVNMKFFGLDFIIEWYKEDGIIERKVFIDIYCYFVGEIELIYISVVISDCDGLVSIVYFILCMCYIM